MDFAALPPEVNSARIVSGPGPGSMLAAAAAWDGLAQELQSAAASYQSVISGLTNGSWLGPSSATVAASVAPHVAWMNTTAAQAAQAGTQARAAANAYEAALAAIVPLSAVTANRSQLLSLIATNLLGQNTAAIAAIEAQYAEMWAQDATTMYGYAGTSTAASKVTPFTAAHQMTNPGGQAAQGAAVANAGATGSGQATANLAATANALFGTPNVLQALTSPAAAGPAASTTNPIQSILNIGPPPLESLAWATEGVVATPTGLAFSWGVSATSWGIAASQAAKLSPAVEVEELGGAAGGAANAAGELSETGDLDSSVTPLGSAGVAAGAGRAALVGGMSVPQSWAAAAPAMHLAAAEFPIAAPGGAGGLFAGTGGLFSGMPLFGGAPLMTMSGRGIADSGRRQPANGKGKARGKGERSPSTER